MSNLSRKTKRNQLKKEIGNNKIQEEWQKEQLEDLPLEEYYKRTIKRR